MHLHRMKFSERFGTPQEWTLEVLTLGKKNLVVGKNASGKSRTLNVINHLARNLSGQARPGLSANYECEFEHDTKIYEYFIHIENEQVITEKLIIDGKQYLSRGVGGEGEIYASEIDGGKEIRYQTPTNEVAAVVRRDSIQHAFLEPLYTWASSLRHIQFGTSLGKGSFAIFAPGGPKYDESDRNAVVALFRQAQKDFGEAFTDALISDMAKLDYNLTEVGIGQPVSFRVSAAPGELVGLYVRESDLPGITDQHSMSQGMFRVLSLFIHLNYFQLKKSATCLLIDDVGEGLDFDRSCRLIDLLRSKADLSDVQLVLSTNDRFVMNQVPLEEWTVLQRIGNHVHVKNYENSREVFEEFKFTGLSNFSFLEMDIIGQSAPEE